MATRTATIDAVIAQDYRFASLMDNALDRDTDFPRCWPNSETTEAFDIVALVEDGAFVFLIYELGAGGRRRARRRDCG